MQAGASQNEPTDLTYFISKASGLGAARVGVLFSGGIDCTVLTFLADRYCLLLYLYFAC